MQHLSALRHALPAEYASHRYHERHDSMCEAEELEEIHSTSRLQDVHKLKIYEMNLVSFCESINFLSILEGKVLILHSLTAGAVSHPYKYFIIS